MGTATASDFDLDSPTSSLAAALDAGLEGWSPALAGRLSNWTRGQHAWEASASRLTDWPTEASEVQSAS